MGIYHTPNSRMLNTYVLQEDQMSPQSCHYHSATKETLSKTDYLFSLILKGEILVSHLVRNRPVPMVPEMAIMTM